VTLSHAPVPGGSVGSRGSHQSAVETADYFAGRFLDLGVELELEEIEDMDEVQDVRQFRNPRNGKVYVKLLAMIGEGHYVPVASGEKKALVIGPRRGAVHAPREGAYFQFGLLAQFLELSRHYCHGSDLLLLIGLYIVLRFFAQSTTCFEDSQSDSDN
jgi:hypothetical protein